MPFVVSPGRHLLFTEQLVNEFLFLACTECETLFPKLNQLLVLVVFHQVSKTCLGEVFKSISVEQRTGRLGVSLIIY